MSLTQTEVRGRRHQSRTHLIEALAMQQVEQMRLMVDPSLEINLALNQMMIQQPLPISLRERGNLARIQAQQASLEMMAQMVENHQESQEKESRSS